MSHDEPAEWADDLKYPDWQKKGSEKRKKCSLETLDPVKFDERREHVEFHVAISLQWHHSDMPGHSIDLYLKKGKSDDYI